MLTSSNKILLLDGGLGTLTEFQQTSTYDNDSSLKNNLWGSRFLYENTELVKDLHLDFLEAGSDIIQTNSYQASIDGFVEAYGLSIERALELIALSVQLCKDSIDTFKAKNKSKECLISGSIGPYGCILPNRNEYTGEYLKSTSSELLKCWHQPKVHCLASAGVDLLAFETIPGLKEIEVFIEILREIPNNRAWISFSSENGTTLGDGSSFESVCDLANRSDQIIGVGINCVCPHEQLESIIKRLRSALLPSKSVLAYPNSFESFSSVEGGWYFPNGEQKRIVSNIGSYSNRVTRWIECGASIVGGCCRVTPNDITEMRKGVDKFLT